MSPLKKEEKEIIERSKSKEELLSHLDSLNRPLTSEELDVVNGGGLIYDECGDIQLGACGSSAMILDIEL